MRSLVMELSIAKGCHGGAARKQASAAVPPPSTLLTEDPLVGDERNWCRRSLPGDEIAPIHDGASRPDGDEDGDFASVEHGNVERRERARYNARWVLMGRRLSFSGSQARRRRLAGALARLAVRNS